MVLDPGLVDWSDPDLAAHTGADGARMVPQPQLEALLAEHVARLGVPVRRGVEVTALDDTGDGVLVGTTAGPVRTGWLVGCDGGHSAVRRLAGIAFPGTDPEITGHQAVVDIADPEKLAGGWVVSARGAYRCGPQPGRVATMEFDDPPADRSAPVTLEEVQTGLRRISGTDVTLTALRATPTRWTDNTRQAATYRSGRVLLAGDAAHVHPPFAPLTPRSPGPRRPRAGRVTGVTDRDAVPGTTPTGVLVRPDGVVAWASDSSDGTDTTAVAGLDAALRRWTDGPVCSPEHAPVG